MAPAPTERFSSGGRGVGIIGLVMVGISLGARLLDADAPTPTWQVTLHLLVAAVIWMVLVRPSVVLRAEELVLRNILRDHRIPYARIADFEVRHVTIVRTEDGRYVGAGLGRAYRPGRREGLGDDAIDVFAQLGPRLGSSDRGGGAVASVVQAKVRHRVLRAEGLVLHPEPTRHPWAWLEIAVVAALAAATAVLGLVG